MVTPVATGTFQDLVCLCWGGMALSGAKNSQQLMFLPMPLLLLTLLQVAAGEQVAWNLPKPVGQACTFDAPPLSSLMLYARSTTF